MDAVPCQLSQFTDLVRRDPAALQRTHFEQLSDPLRLLRVRLASSQFLAVLRIYQNQLLEMIFD